MTPEPRVQHRPPVRQSVMVRSDREHTFHTFVRTIGEWWPTANFSRGGAAVCDVTVEPVLGGRVFETLTDGSTHVWGEIRAWEPTTAFTMSWLYTPAPTEVEFTFRALGPSLTRVSVEHLGWEVLDDRQMVEDCALPGGYGGGAFSAGWRHILSSFAATMPTGADQEEKP